MAIEIPKYQPQDQVTKTVGQWRWNDSLLWTKIQQADINDCWTWQGATGPHANLFGARKNNKPQMSQAPRFIWMSVTGEDAAELEIKHTCRNRYCTNPFHLYAVPNHMRYRKDGTLATEPPPQIARVQAQPVTKKLWWQI